MTTIKLICTGAMARATVDGPLTHGMVGVPVEVEWDEAWEGLLKTMKFRCGDVSRTAIVDGDATVTVPHECLISGQWLEIGLDGWDTDGNLRIPSGWASCGMVKPSVAQVDAPEGAPPTPDTVAQLQILVNKAETAAGELAEAADDAASSASDAYKSAQDAQDALDKTTAIAASTPYIGENGNWFFWDADHGSYVDSGVRAVGKEGAPGADGHTPEYGVDYGTPEQIDEIAQQAADILKPGINQIKDDKLDKPETPPDAAGKVLRVLAVNDDGTFTCEWADATSAEGGWKLIEKTEPITEPVASFEFSLNGNERKILVLATCALNNADNSLANGNNGILIGLSDGKNKRESYVEQYIRSGSNLWRYIYDIEILPTLETYIKAYQIAQNGGFNAAGSLQRVTAFWDGAGINPLESNPIKITFTVYNATHVFKTGSLFEVFVR